MKRRDFIITSIAGITGAILGANAKALAKTIEDATRTDVVLIHLENLYVNTSSGYYEVSGQYNPKLLAIKIDCNGDFEVQGSDAVDKIIRAFEDNRLVDFVFEKDDRILKGKCYITAISNCAAVDDEVRIMGVVSSYGPVTATTKNGLITDLPTLYWK